MRYFAWHESLGWSASFKTWTARFDCMHGSWACGWICFDWRQWFGMRLSLKLRFRFSYRYDIVFGELRMLIALSDIWGFRKILAEVNRHSQQTLKAFFVVGKQTASYISSGTKVCCSIAYGISTVHMPLSIPVYNFILLSHKIQPNEALCRLSTISTCVYWLFVETSYWRPITCIA